MSRDSISIETAEHYTWGGADRDQSNGWHLVRTTELSIIEESMPPGASETLHHHSRARQFFYVLEGTLTMQLKGEPIVLYSGHGLEIAPGEPHQAFNLSDAPVRFLVTSRPPSHGDRIEDSPETK
jgi:mannose-6-phosphate isomerase-like protein (cupin superfamily)